MVASRVAAGRLSPASEATLEFASLSRLTNDQTAAYRAIFEEAFPAWQRDPFDFLLQGETDPSRRQLAMLRDGEVLGLAVASRFRSVPWWFLEYFAVADGHRDKGLGGALWAATLDRLGPREDLRLVMELERPEEAPQGSGERVIRERRVRFYRRLGAERLAVPTYRVPHLAGDGTERLELFAVTTADDGMPPDEQLSALVRALYVEGYGLPADDPLLAEALASVEAADDGSDH